jgi:hypothetical protein
MTGFKLLGRSIWRTFEGDFGQTLQRLTQHTELLKEHVLLANTVQVNALLGGQGQQPGLTSQAISNLMVRIF